MNDVLENKLSMYQKVQGYLTLHAADLSAVASVATLQTELDTEVRALQSFAAQSDADMSGHTVDKQNSRTALKNALLKVSTAVVAHASINSINKLLEKCDETPSQIDYMRDNDFYTYCQTVSAEATPIVADLAPYNVVAADITALDTAAANFLTVIQDPRLQINERSNALNNLHESFDTVDALLKNKLDKVMAVFISINESLYNGYKGARSIDDDGSGASDPDFDLSIEAGSTNVIANIPYLLSRTFTFKNLGSEPLNFALSTNDTDLEGTPVEVVGGGESQRNSANLNSDTNAANLLVQNNGGRTINYKIWIVE